MEKTRTWRKNTWNLFELPELRESILLEVNLISVVARIALALLLGGILGAERGRGTVPPAL